VLNILGTPLGEKGVANSSEDQPAQRQRPLVPAPFPELVFGLVGPAGTDLKPVFSALRRALVEVGYNVHKKEFKLSSLIEDFLEKDYSSLPDDERVEKLMDDGTHLRQAYGRGNAVALLAVMEIIHVRKEELGGEFSRNAYILSSIKHPDEISTLRAIYGKGFFAVSVYSPRDERVTSLAQRFARARPLKKEGMRARAEQLIERDELEEGTTLGQAVKDSFPLADLFVDARDTTTLDDHVNRFIDMLFGYPFHTPTRDEYAMYHAKSAAVRSADLGRQVGAAIATGGGDIIAVGCNDVPKADGGGLYWAGDKPDGRDFQVGVDAGYEQREQILAELIGRLSEHEWLADKYRGRNYRELVAQLLTGKDKAVLKKTQVVSLLEFGRPVHAEMAAITDAARRGVSVRNATLYSTTFPCHMCAKHIVAAGISRCVYIEPYPKSKARELYPDSIVVDPAKRVENLVNFEPFVGVAPRQYLEIFEMEGIERKDDYGRRVEWSKHNAKPRITRYQNTYREIELAVVAVEIEVMRKQVGANRALFKD
jgi:deoxycytidylate deaminase